jgi:Protein of unknown function (DUF3489)
MPTCKTRSKSAKRKSAANKRASKAPHQKKAQESNTSGQPSSGASVYKQDIVLGMLRRAKGTTVAAIVEATGWQPHSVRGFFAGVIKKKLKLKLDSDKVGEERIYRIAKPGVS